MRRTRNGTYERSLFHGDEFRAFIPNPLPPIPPLDMDLFHQALESAHLAVGYLDALIARLPAIEPLLHSYIRREAVVSSQIEGMRSTFTDLLLYELGSTPSVPIDDTREVSNYVAALRHGIARLDEGFPLSGRLIREVHGILMSGEARQHLAPGEFRRSQNWIGGARPSLALYVPPPAAAVPECIAQLDAFVHDDTVMLPTIVKAGLAHAQFESVHPFLDGNGRAGRVLIALMLHSAAVLSDPALYLSLYFRRRQSEYYAYLGQLREDGDWELWLRYFIDGVVWTAEDCIATAEQLIELFERDRELLLQQGRRASSAVRAHEAFAGRPILHLRELSKITGLSGGAAASAAELMLALGILHELTGRRRDRIYAYREYVSAFTDEPLQ